MSRPSVIISPSCTEIEKINIIGRNFYGALRSFIKKVVPPSSVHLLLDPDVSREDEGFTPLVHYIEAGIIQVGNGVNAQRRRD